MGRESRLENDLFFVCSVIEYIGRKTKNRRVDVVQKIGEKELERILSLADIYHCEPIGKLSDDLVSRFHIEDGNFDNVKICEYSVPSFFDIAKVYKRLINFVVNHDNVTPINALFNVYSSSVSAKIDDYNSSMYFENPQYLEVFYTHKTVPEIEIFKNYVSPP
jgi:hypothetical protein